MEDHLLLFGRLRGMIDVFACIICDIYVNNAHIIMTLIGLHGIKLREDVAAMAVSLGFPDKVKALAGM